jgi:hypothetical protein
MVAMAICTYCDRDMRSATSCNVAVLHHMGQPYLLRTHEPEPGSDLDERCFDCGAEVGGLHHLGCEQQVCPRCDDHRVWCGCLWDDFLYSYLALGLLEGESPDELDALLRSAFARFVCSLAPTSGAVSHV